MQDFNFKLYTSSAKLPEEWDSIARKNIFLSQNYLTVLEKAAPENMQCYFIGLFSGTQLCGVALAQYIDLSRINTFAEAKKKFSLKDYVFRKVSSHIIVIGNNTLTGQNAYLINEKVSEKTALILLREALNVLCTKYKKEGIRINLLAVKDFNAEELPDFKAALFNGYYTFCTQPNMIFEIRKNWVSIENYIADLNKKYRTQYNRARKKAEGIEKKKLSIDEIRINEKRIYELYMTVAENASFNTFHLPQNHFYIFKDHLKDNFSLYGYFLNGRLIGFSTIIKNGPDMDTYFLGYDDEVQRDKMLYLNMLYDMVGYAIKKQFNHIIFARSAMEIKSSVGANAEDVFGIIKHTNPVINFFMAKLFPYFDPKIEWKTRNPFK